MPIVSREQRVALPGERITISHELDDGGRRLCFRLAVPLPYRRFLKDELWFHYETPVNGVPKSLLMVAALGALAPVVWCCGATLEVPAADRTYLEFLSRAQLALRRLYPDSTWNGSVVCPEPLAQESNPGAVGCALLFSQGVDSLVSFFRLNDRQPALVTIRGADTRLGQTDAWAVIRKDILRFAAVENVRSHMVSTNLREVVRETALFPRLRLPWWPFVGHALACTALTAPLAWVHGWTRIYEAAGSPEADCHELRWAAHPEIIARMAWSGVKVIEEGPELPRQAKIEFLAAAIAAGRTGLRIRVCWRHRYGGNCGCCEKCCRTIAGLSLAGVDPARHGFAISPGTCAFIKESLLKGRWSFRDENRLFWSDMQRRIPLAEAVMLPTWRTFFDWLAAVPARQFQTASIRRWKWRLQGWLSRLPEFILRPLLWIREYFR